MMDWWKALETINQVFYAAAAFFSVVFLWQFISSLIGLAGTDADVDADIDGDADLDLDDIEAHSIEEAAESTMAFRIFTVRAILAFFTLFAWAGALYLDAGRSVGDSLARAMAWGFAAWLFIALLINWLRRLAETGTPKLSTAVGQRGSVYLDIPDGGQGEVRVLVSGAMSLVKARTAGGAMKAGTPVRIVRVLDAGSVEVEPAEAPQEPKEGEP